MWAGVAQLVEYKLPKLGVASSNLVARSSVSDFICWRHTTFSVEIVAMKVGFARFFLCPNYRAWQCYVAHYE